MILLTELSSRCLLVACIGDRTSLQYGIACLKRVNYDRIELDRRRDDSTDDVKGNNTVLYAAFCCSKNTVNFSHECHFNGCFLCELVPISRW